MSSIADAVAAGDLDQLIRLVDGLAAGREWRQMIDLRDRCRHSLEQRGLQLWPAAEYAEYRLALDAPGEFAASVVETEAGRFALGPLWEVAASTHEWGELRDHLPAGPSRALCAHDRVLRGEDLAGDDSIDRNVLEIPLSLQAWEPRYRTATYRADEAEFDAPELAVLIETELPAAAPAIGDEESIEALLDVGSVWARHSNGVARAVAVEGHGLEAIAALGHTGGRVGSVEPEAAVGHLAWAAASGGAYGRRRGAPVGRFIVWWLVAALSDLDWPVDPDELGSAADRLLWQAWEPQGQPAGWSASFSIESPETGLSWALEAHDSYREGDLPEELSGSG